MLLVRKNTILMPSHGDFFMKKLIDRLALTGALVKKDYQFLVGNISGKDSKYLSQKAVSVANNSFQKQIYLRGLIEVSSYCKSNCHYCGIRSDNKKAKRYRLTKDEILRCCRTGYDLGIRTFVLQGGEDSYFSDNLIEDIVFSIRSQYPDTAITLSLGEKSKASYLRYFRAGADRYLLRHETADAGHFAKLHPINQTLERRLACLYDLKSIGYQTGVGFMVGSPWQTSENIAEDLLFIQQFKPEMVGIGPFIPHCDTVFKNFHEGSVELTLHLISILRLMIPNLLIPSTTALGSVDRYGFEKGVLAGANVIMPNLSPADSREKYLLYNNKIITGMETAEGISDLKKRMKILGYDMPAIRGDFKTMDPCERSS